MSRGLNISEPFVKQTQELVLGDRQKYGWIRLMVLMGAPLLVLFLDIRWQILGSFSSLYRQLLVLYFVSLLSVLAAAIAYLKDIYGLESDRLPFRHFVSSFWGLGIPRIKISNRMQESGWKEMIERIGGPAILNIKPGYAVLTEYLTSPAHIFGQGNGYFISRQERIREIIDLHEQEGSSPEVEATTRDGITVTVGNLKFNYQLWDSQWEAAPSTQKGILNPYPFSAEAIYNLVYNRTVAVDEYGKKMPFSWMGTVRRMVQGIIKGYINEHRLDDVIASRERLQENPRADIRDRAYQPGFKERLRAIGTVLRWWDPGEFRSIEPIEGQFLSNWSVDITSNIQLNRAYGEAQKQAYAELGRAEAEAELLMSIIHSLDGIRFGQDKAHTLQNLILMRTAQVIRALNTTAPDGQQHRTDESNSNRDRKK